MHRVRLRDRLNVLKRKLAHVAGFDLGLPIHAILGIGTPRGWLAAFFTACGELWAHRIAAALTWTYRRPPHFEPVIAARVA